VAKQRIRTIRQSIRIGLSRAGTLGAQDTSFK
jgi:hypothetical protein